ncbi:efflux RND transporter periplasmic adaptor subunit [Methylomarinum vadi]|uniref:efflux RND transporter periplasmic adaptor subunit n=1 Tax=Methylomarinum vadi TaxID=438855 RepID=UPI0004DF3FFA|nr:efflux RND transporter periplasmic adaptor subunit [Methylomarinum vadi]
MNKSLLITATLMLIVGLAVGYWLAPKRMGVTTDSERTEKRPLFYRHPMNPEITSPVPAKDDMGMDYIPVYAEEQKGPQETPGTVIIDGGVVQSIGVRTAKAKRETLSHVIRTVGRIGYDEELLVRLHPKTEGWIEEVRVDKTGDWVRQNDDLLSIYSPQLVASQQEYLLALNNLKALEQSPFEDIRRGAEELLQSSLERLKLLDVPEHQLHDLIHQHKIRKSLHIHSPTAGIVMNIGAREGQYVTPATELYMIADLTRVWVYADIYEYELPWVKPGDPVDMHLAGVPGRIFSGHLAYIYPYAEARTRTIKVRLAFDNPDLLLKPEMYSEITIHAGSLANSITIPSEAVIRSGARNQVFVVTAPGRFEPRLVKLGLSSGGKVAVLDGIEPGEEVVTSAQFLIDSESKLREAAAKMIAPKPQSKNGESMPMQHEHNATKSPAHD